MPDLLRIKRNVAKMIDAGAPEEDIDAYIKEEGTTINAIKNIKITGQKPTFYSEVISPFVAGSSSLAFGIPRAVARQTGTEQIIYPEQQTLLGKGIRLGSEAVGLLGGGAAKGAGLAIKGAEKFIPRLAGKGLMRGIVRGGLGAGTFGLLQQPPQAESILAPQERIQQAAGFATLGGALPIAGAGLKGMGQIVTKTGRWIAKNMGISDATVSIIKRLGADRVFELAKAQTDYIGSNIVPRVKERITNLITNFTPKSKFILKEIGMTPDEINILNTIDKSKLTQLQKIFGNDWNAIKNGLEGIKEQADLQFKTTLQKNPNALINPKETFYKLQALLRKQGWIDYRGNEITGAGITNKTKTNLIKIYQDLKSGLITAGKERATGQINTTQYFNKLSELETSLSGNPKFDRLVFEVQDSLRNDATKAIKGLMQANKSYSDAVKLLDLEKIFTKISDPLNWEKQLTQLKNTSKFQLQLKYKNILGQEIYDDLLAHLANQDFELVSNLPAPGGGFYPSRAGFLKKGITGLSKEYYRRMQPKLQPVTSKLQEVLDKIISMQK